SRGEPVLRRGGHPHAHRSRCDRPRGRALDRDGPRRQRGDPRHAAEPAARADRQARAGDETDAPRRVRDRSAVRCPYPRAPPGDEDRMKAAAELGMLEASGLIQVAALEPELEYLFRHALVQDAAYASLLKQDRRTLHRLAAETLLATYPGRERELAAVIAMHYEQAGDARAAAPYLVDAGEHAQERFANREALSFFERAVALLASDPRIELGLRAVRGMAKGGWSFTVPAQYHDRLERKPHDDAAAARPAH